MKKVNKYELTKLLEAFDGDKISITYTTNVQMNKYNNPLYEKLPGNRYFTLKYPVTKTVTATYGFGKSYQQAVNEQLAAQGLDQSFVAKKADWSVPVVSNKVYEHKDTHDQYIRLFIDKDFKPTVQYFSDGKPSPQHDLNIIDVFERRYTSENYSCKTQEDLGIEKKDQIRIITVNFKHIDTITIGDETYELEK